MDQLLYTVVCSLFAAFYFISNDIYKIRADSLILWRSLIALAIMAPYGLMNQHIVDPSFYLLIIAAGFLAGIGDVYLFNATKEYSAAAISRITTSRNILLFFIWPLVVSGYWERLTESPLVFYSSLLLLLISTVSLFKMRHNKLSIAVIIAALPSLVLVILSDTLLGLGLYHRPSFDHAFYTSFIMLMGMSLASITAISYNFIKGKGEFFPQHWLKASAVNGFFLIGMMTTKNMAIAQLENPGYFGAMVSIYTLWLYILQRYWLKREDKADPMLGFIVVLCSIGLGILSTQIVPF